MNTAKSIAVFLAGLLLAASLAGCADPDGGETISPTGSSEPAFTEHSTDPADPTENPDVIAVSTPRGDLYYPEQWADFMKTEQVTEGETLTVRFSAAFDGAEYALFDIIIGPGADEPVTQITDADGVRHNVYVTVAEDLEHPELTADEQNRLYAMQESINDVIESIR